MRRHHPFWKKEHSFKYIYCFGLGVMSMGHMKSITETQDFFNELLEAIALPEEDRQQIFYDLNNHFEQWIDKVFAVIRSKEEQYCFTLDLYSVLRLTAWAKEYCSQVLEDYLQIFQFSTAERQFFEEFYQAARQKSISRAVEAYQRLAENGYSIRYDFLTWFYPEFYMEDSYAGIHVLSGETVVLDHPSAIRGNVEVEKGGSLLIYGASLRMEGSILVRGGRLQIDHGEIQLLDCPSSFWLQMEETSVVTIIDTTIDCQYHCGVLRQSSGRLLVEDSWFQRTEGARALHFSGKSIVVRHTHFHQGRDGMIGLEGTPHAVIERCDFQNCYAEYGGAIYSDTIHDVQVEHCTFRECKAKYLGAAVYFKNQKLGQWVEECKCVDCVPQEEPFFNCIEIDSFPAS